MGTSLELAWVYSAVRCLFWEWPEGGGRGLLDLCLGTSAAAGLGGHQA